MRAVLARAAVALALVAAATGCWPSGSSPPVSAARGCRPGTIERADARIDRIVSADARIECLADGYSWVEGPVWDRAGRALLFSDIPANAIYRWRPGEGVRVHIERSGYTGETRFDGREPGSNGLAFDREGRLVVCQHGDRRVVRIESDGTRTTLADRYEGKRLNSPNDVVVASDGTLYFTDPPFGLPETFGDPARELDFCGVYRLPPGGPLELVTRELEAPNGIALSPDERTLYVANARHERPVVVAYTLGSDGAVGSGRTLFDFTPWQREGRGTPDGMAVDRQGSLFVAGPGGVHVIGLDGIRLGMIGINAATSNCAWGEDETVLYVTADDAVYRVEL